MAKAKKRSEQSPVPRVMGEMGRSKPVLLSFPDAIEAVMNGNKIRRVEWNDQEEHGLLKDSFLTIFRNGKFHTWIVSEGDMLAIDWVILK